jgi:hypothetical protein
MEKLHADVRQIFKSTQFQNKPLTHHTLAQDFIWALVGLGYTHDQLAIVTNCQVVSFDSWCLWSFQRHDSQFQRDTNRIQSWLNQHLDTETPKPLPADIWMWVARKSDMKAAIRLAVPVDSRVQDIPKFIVEDTRLGIKSELDIEALTLDTEPMEWTRFCSSYDFSGLHVVVVHSSE